MVSAFPQTRRRSHRVPAKRTPLLLILFPRAAHRFGRGTLLGRLARGVRQITEAKEWGNMIRTAGIKGE